MENPRRELFRLARVFVASAAIGAIPLAIRVDQLHRELDFERAGWTKLNEQLRTAILDEEGKHDADRLDCTKAILGDDARTVLIDGNHPYGAIQQNIFGVWLTMRRADDVSDGNLPGPIWVVPRAITPHVIDGVLGGAYTHIWPDGRTDGWKIPSRAE